ncbi:DNA polymerase II large subunit, partial [Candidatus Woesearchaeota archaeon]|nr:DNA polymerase II large subunit [Candidatus Woesearchaeota archaeon]
LVPCGYNEEWHTKNIEKATVDFFGTLDFDKLSELVSIPEDKLRLMVKNPTKTKISARAAINTSEKLNVPLHPEYTYHWDILSSEQLLVLLEWLKKIKFEFQEGKLIKTILPLEKESKNLLGSIGVPHIVISSEFVVINKNNSLAFLYSLGMIKKEDIVNKIEYVKNNIDKKTLEIINEFSKIKIMDKSGTFIGARMGRPEKAKMRKLTGNPQTLFPIGEEGGRMRSIQAALEKGKITADFPIYQCTKCNKETIYHICETCGKETKKMYASYDGNITENKTDNNFSFRKKPIDINHYFEIALNKLGMKSYPDLIKGVKGTSNKDHIPENLAKGILRAKHDISVNKDGTIRYDMTELPITHFKPSEIRTPVEKLKEMGYKKDINGKELVDKEQIIELKPQDLILASCSSTNEETSDSILFRVGNFIDELLKKFYNMKPFYNFKNKEDLVGHLVIGLAPHISAGMIGRIIGFSNTQACFAHPLWHASLRRDCDGDECCVIMFMDSLLNFSRQFLPNRRGSKTMDSPLVLTSKLAPSEVDDMVHGLDVLKEYPLELYKAALEYKYPWEIEIEQLGDRLDTPDQYENINFTHSVSNINIGVVCSAYKTLPSMEEKLNGQMELAKRIRAVDESDVARLVIEKHFLKDTKGNLRKFSQQQFRCVNCNEKFRRPPLIGKCTKCNGRIIFTVSEGSVIKYLDKSINLAEEYNVPNYVKQTLELTRRNVESIFGREKEKQVGLGTFT